MTNFGQDNPAPACMSAPRKPASIQNWARPSNKLSEIQTLEILSGSLAHCATTPFKQWLSTLILQVVRTFCVKKSIVLQ